METVKIGAHTFNLTALKGKTEQDLRDMFQNVSEGILKQLIEYVVPKQTKPKPTKKAK